MKNSLAVLLLAVGLTTPLATVSAADRGGVRPLGKDGKPLNLDFEEGTLKDWKAEGAAFQKQPVKGDLVAVRRPDMKSQHQGSYWVGSYEIGGDEVKGTLTSAPFKVTEPFGSFLLAGGTHDETRVELVMAEDQSVFFKASGAESENLRPVVVDLSNIQGKEIFIRLVDNQSGGWGHLNFDDFKFHATRPKFDDEWNPTRAAEGVPAVDTVKYAGLSPEDAARFTTVPDGFKMNVFAGEPDVKQPIAFALDHRGRLWVAEAYTYPTRAPEGQGKDRILIFEDTDGDHKFDKRTVFIEGLNLVSGMEVGYGGVYVGAAPYLMFIADKDGDDKADGPPEILLDGFAYQDTHETLNTFNWGPDGWLYGCHGVFTQSNVGKPGAADKDRTRINAGIWRYHPTRHTFEVFAEGSSNPWGIDFDANGQCIIEACVIPHLFHMIQGGRFERQAGQHFNPNVYDDIKTIADHRHYAGTKGPHAANGRSDSMGGGHAHAGLLIYQGDSFPEQYQGKIFMNNIHGQRLNMDVPERSGSGFIGKHGADFINFNDRWSQVLNMISDQDGSVYICDWYDANQCHHNNYEGHDRSNGRIFKLIYNDQKTTPIDLTKKNDQELLELLGKKNHFYARHAKKILLERGVKPDTQKKLGELAKSEASVSQRLNALWTLMGAGLINDELALPLLKDSNEYMRAWTIQGVAENKNVSDAALKEFVRLAKDDPSPVVRLYLASALQRVEPGRRWETLGNLVAHGEDGGDHNLPLMYWYAAEGSVAIDKKEAIKLMAKSKLPKMRQFITRRIATENNPVVSK